MRIPVAREGWPFILGSLIPALIAAALGWIWVCGILFALSAACAFFFRDPERKIPEEEALVVAPADGRVIAVEEVERAGFPGGRAWRVRIFLSVLNVHINRAPIGGTVESVEHTPGRFHNALFERAAVENEHNLIAFNSPRGYNEVNQIAGAIARRIVCHAKEGQTIARGARIGLIRFGSQTEAYVPAETEIWAKSGDRVRGGITPIGRLPAGEARSCGKSTSSPA